MIKIELDEFFMEGEQIEKKFRRIDSILSQNKIASMLANVFYRND